MVNSGLINKTEQFLKKKYDSGEYLSSHPEERAYREEHSYRVANIGRIIASGEGFDETEMVIACLLHDISYCENFGEEGWVEHGRRSAKIARPFLKNLGLKEDRINDICYGIAIHVDDKADFDGAKTAFALSVGDADNIDRFGAYRIHEALLRDGFIHMALGEKKEYITKRLSGLDRIANMPMGTKIAEALWKERIDFYKSFLKALEYQINHSESVHI